MDEDCESSQTSIMGFDTKPKPKVNIVENQQAPFFPYEPRPGQLDIVHDIVTTLDEGRHLIMESGTGTGKTIVSLAGGLQHARMKGKKIVYLTRTISQSDQVMKELKAISALRPVSGMTLTGRSKSCPLFSGEEFEGMAPNVISMMCDSRKAKSNRNQSGGCIYYERTKTALDDVRSYCMSQFPRSEELDRYCEAQKVCPYEMKKMLMKDFDVIVAPYIHIVSGDIRDNFINNLGGEGTRILLIIDEAHNLIEAAREQESFSISMRLIESALDECGLLRKTPEITEGVRIDEFIKELSTIVKSIATENVPFGKKEAKLEGDPVSERLMKRFGLTHPGLDSAIESINHVGENRVDALMDSGDNASSLILELGEALSKWITSEDGRYIRSVKVDDDGEYLHAACIDPSDLMNFMRSQDCALHMSGTLQPLEEYAKIIGLPKNSRPRIYPSPFPKENRSVIYVDNLTSAYADVTRDPTIKDRMTEMIVRLCNAVDKNTLVFFTSYRQMRESRPYIESGISSKELYWEESGRQKKTMRSLDLFRRGSNGVFFCVMGGSVAEGMDFPGDELSFAIITGIPYPPPSMEQKAMSELFDRRYGQGTGWKYASEVPAIRKMRQAIGRLIRTETDRGMAVILDSRAKKYVRQLEAELSKDPVADAVEFFSKN